MQENTSDITSAKTKQMQTVSTLFKEKYCNKMILIIIFTPSSKVCEIADLYAFLTAEKYPFITDDIAIQGRPIAIK